jgi:hypothetical protein
MGVGMICISFPGGKAIWPGKKIKMTPVFFGVLHLATYISFFSQ